MGYNCANDDGNAANVIVTNLDTGDTQGVCGNCLVGWAFGLLVALTGHDWQPAGDVATDPNTGDATDEDEAGDGPTVPAPVPAPATPAEDAPPAGDDGGDQADDVPADSPGLSEDVSREVADIAAGRP